MTSAVGILEGVEQLVDDWLELSFDAQTPLYQHKTAALEISKRKSIPPATEFLLAADKKIAANWESNRRLPSQQNWRFTQREYISAENDSREVGLERAIIQAADIDHWANQVPTSSGLMGSRTDKARNVDLAPHEYYFGDQRLNLTLLGQAINQGLAELLNTIGIEYAFEFTEFGEAFDSLHLPEQLLKHAEHREAIWKAVSNYYT